MTLEAAFAKLHFLIATGAAPQAMRAMLGQALSGELS
jgi:hypothetical protein